jgi:hypothetical protein
MGMNTPNGRSPVICKVALADIRSLCATSVYLLAFSAE